MMWTSATSPVSALTIIRYTCDDPGPPNCVDFPEHTILFNPLPIYISWDILFSTSNLELTSLSSFFLIKEKYTLRLREKEREYVCVSTIYW